MLRSWLLQRRFLSTGGIILNRRSEIVVRPNRRTYVPWREGRTLRYEYA